MSTIHTANDGHTYRGRFGIVTMHTLQIRLLCLDTRDRWGQLDVLLEVPSGSGSGQKWFSLDSVRFEAN